MALILAAGYAEIVLRNLGGRLVRVSFLRLSGRRPTAVAPLIVNSLLQTNLGMPHLFLIHEATQGCSRRRESRAMKVDS